MPPAAQPKPSILIPPPEKFWTRYSPHHEAPLAGMTSFFIHALVVGLMTLAGVWLLYQRESEANKPPSMDMIQVAGGGDGIEGAGGEPGSPGEPGPTETVQPAVSSIPEFAANSGANLKEAPQVELTLPEITSPESSTDAESMFAKLQKQATDQANLEKAKKTSTPSKKPAAARLVGTGNPKGTGGQGGSGGGPGRGYRGKGFGAGGFGGNPTQARIYARRWKFWLHGQGKDLISKYIAMGVQMAVHSPSGQIFFIEDLRRRPVGLRQGKLPNADEVVMWGMNEPLPISLLASELKLTFIPTVNDAPGELRGAVFISLPPEQVKTLADVESRYAKKNGRSLEHISFTMFDFELRNGRYEPVVLDQK